MIPKSKKADVQYAVDADVRKAYDILIEKNDFYRAAKLKGRTGLKPVIDGQMRGRIQMMYLNDLEKGFIGHARDMEEFTGIRPKLDGRMMEAIQNGYRNLFEERPFGFKDAERLKEFSGVGPSKKVVNEVYAKCSRSEVFDLYTAKKLKEFSGIAPSKRLLSSYPYLAEALE